MTTALLTRSARVLAVATLCWTSGASQVFAEPVLVTSGWFEIGFDNPSAFRFFGANGFELSSIFVVTPTSPQRICSQGCAPGAVVDMSALAGGDSSSTPFPLGFVTAAVIDGTVFLPPFGMSETSPRLTGTLRFDAPSIVIPPVDSSSVRAAPFAFTGEVTGYAHDDPHARTPLFHLTLIGQGMARLQFEDLLNGVFLEPVTTYEFSAVPEPATMTLLGAGLIGLAARKWTRYSSPAQSSTSSRPSNLH